MSVKWYDLRVLTLMGVGHPLKDGGLLVEG